jgi:hypothetical protein
MKEFDLAVQPYVECLGARPAAMERLARQAMDDKAFASYHSPAMKSTAL